MSKVINLIGGLAGALTLNIVHESIKKTSSDMPRIDLLGEDALQHILHYFGTSLDNKKELYSATLAGDIMSNTLYYSLIGAGNPKYIWAKAAVMGISAGIGALKLPEPMGLDPRPVTKTEKTQVLTVGYYLLGAVVTGLAITLMNRKFTK